MNELRFPIGPFELPALVSASEKKTFTETISTFPERIATLTQGLDEATLGNTYRPGGWTIRQLVHHCADSHMNAYIRFKLTLTEDTPTIKPYEEAKWAEFDDYLLMPVKSSLAIIKGVHARWERLIESMSDEDFQSSYVHPEHGLHFRLDQALANYNWHCKHHLAHIELALYQDTT